MRILTVISGILLAAAGGFCYYFSTSAFSTLAFVLGAAMAVSGVFILLTYLVGIRTPSRLPETVFVEGLVTALFGFAVLNNQIGDAMLTTFFGTWLTLAGVTRLSQSFSISRHNSRDWAKIIPFAILSTAGGVVMLMQKLVEAYNPVALVGTAFLLNAISQLLYALYMKPHVPKERELEAKARAEAKENEEMTRRQEKERLRKMSKAERKALEAEQKAEKEAEVEALKEADAKALEEAEKNPAGVVSGDTISLSAEEVDEIREQTDEAYQAELKAAEEAAKAEAESEEPAADIRPTWHKPTDIPSLRTEAAAEETAEQPEGPVIEEPKINAVNLEELEGEKEVSFEKVELPQPKYMAEGGEARRREEFLRELDAAEHARNDNASFTAVSLEELIEERVPASVTDAEKQDLEMKLTAEYTFQWPKKVSREDVE